MKTVYLRYGPDEPIPAQPVIHKKKLVKYYTRETLAAVLAVSRLQEGNAIPEDTPFYYSSADAENFECFRELLEKLDAAGIHEMDAYHYVLFAPPTAQFKMMRNMTPCFVSIENGLKGDNNVFVDSASALLYSALTAPGDGEVLIGAGYLHEDESVEVGFAMARPEEFAGHPMLGSDARAIEIFRP